MRRPDVHSKSIQPTRWQLTSVPQWLSRAGRAEEALKSLDDVLRRDPFPPSWHWGNRATAFLCLERYEDAIAAINRKSRTFWWDHYMRGVVPLLS